MGKYRRTRHFSIFDTIAELTGKIMSQPIDPLVNQENIKKLGLTTSEFNRIKELLGRHPNFTELSIFSVMWSEHCSYKSSKVHLKNLPSNGPRVIEGPGENAGAMDIGDGLAVVFKIESHNHPSFVEPHQGAATGVGGILRDIFTMGARPIALLDSLRFGSLEEARTRYLLRGVTEGISSYGNCVGVPTVGGEISFDTCYNSNNLVNVFCLGMVQSNRIFRAKATGVGNAVMYVGSKTGLDGIHGASLLASTEFDETTESKRPTVQVGDPFTEKLLIEACLEAVTHDWVVGFQDMGAAGLTSSSFEMASRSGTGIDMDLSKIPCREKGMKPNEILLSESQERMLLIVKKGYEEEAKLVFKKWDLDAEVVGRVTEKPFMRITTGEKEEVNLPVAAVVDSAPVYHRLTKEPSYLKVVDQLNLKLIPIPERGDKVLKQLLGCLNIASKAWVYEKYDHMVGLNTLVFPGSDASVIRIKGSKKAVAISVDGNSRYCYLDPYFGAQIAIAEAYRNVICSGGEPIGLTNCLNFGNPEKPEVMWEFEQCVLGMGAACNFFNLPVVSGNVSLYNETKGKSIYPTPIIAVVGLLEDQKLHCTQWFKKSNDLIGLLGITKEELGGTEYLNTVLDLQKGKIPTLDLKQEKKVNDLCLKWIRAQSVVSAHDCSEGGLGVAVAESCFSGPCETQGARLDFSSSLRPDALLFGESQARIVVSFAPENFSQLEREAKIAKVDFNVIGKVGGSCFEVTINGQEYIRQPIDTLSEIWKNSLENYGRQVS